MHLGAVCCPAGIQREERPSTGSPSQPPIRGKKAEDRNQSPGFQGATLSTDPQPPCTPCLGWLEQILGVLWGTRCGSSSLCWEK